LVSEGCIGIDEIATTSASPLFPVDTATAGILRRLAGEDP
jgi:hypothetical protein